jgi:predicted permease
LTAFIASLTAHERLAVAGAVVVAASLALPWYGVALGGGLVKTALGTFGLIEAALMVTVGAVIALVVACSRGFELPRPLREGSLLAAAGVWSAALIGYRVLDRPDFGLAAVGDTGLRYGIFVALLGAGLMVVGGLRKRREELAAEAARR